MDPWVSKRKALAIKRGHSLYTILVTQISDISFLRYDYANRIESLENGKEYVRKICEYQIIVFTLQKLMYNGNNV